jgi:hypothetical protein
MHDRGTERDHHDGEGMAVGEWIRDAYKASLDVDTAARHLWVIHRAAKGLMGRRARLRQGVAALSLSVAMVATSGVAVALSADALPGDNLYPVKRGTERIHALVTRAPEADARLQLSFARTRLGEATAIADRSPHLIPGIFEEAAALLERAESLGGEAVADDVVAVRGEAEQAVAALAPQLDHEVATALDGVARRFTKAPTADQHDDEAIAAAPADVEPMEAEEGREADPLETTEETVEPELTPTPEPEPGDEDDNGEELSTSPGPTPIPATPHPAREEPRRERTPSVRQLGEMVSARHDESPETGDAGDPANDDADA